MDLNDTIDRIKTGNSLLFCGAGFSIDSINLMDSKPLLAKELSQKICDIGGFEKDEDLRYTSDYLISTYPSKIPVLIKELQNNYTMKEVSESAKIVCSHKWRRIYTTNYDNIIEFASNQTGQYIDSVTIDDNPKNEIKKERLCVHINGAINKLNTTSLNSSFKLSKSSYVSPDSFEKSEWYYPFKKDLEQASALVFLGYSLYDIEIEKILFASKYREKTIFIIGTSESEKTKYQLGKYGKIEAIGLDRFANSLGYYIETKDIDKSSLKINKYELSDISKEIDDEDIRKFLLQGVLFSGYIDNFISGTPKKPFLIRREKITEIINSLKKGLHVVIHSDFGNGKTVCLEILKSILTMEGKEVYFVSDYDIDYTRDIELICKVTNDIFLVIDGYTKYIELLEYIFTLNQPNIKLIMADRTSNHVFGGEYISKNISFFEFNFDLLSNEKEIDSMIDIISNIGFWGDKISLGINRQRAFLTDANRSKISSILLSIFDSPQIRDKVNSILLPLLSDANYKKVVFAICLINIMDFHAKESLISEIAMNDLIYSYDFVKKPEFKELFVIQDDEIKEKSSIFSRLIIQNYFDSSYIIDSLLEIAEKFEKKHTAGIIEHEIFRSLLRFSFIESLLPSQQKISSLRRYYQDLKTRISWLKTDPHYWLQYGMAELMFLKLDAAQKYFDSAYELAKKRENYDTSYIDTQQARLYIQNALQESDGKQIYNYFIKAHDLLRNLGINHYSCRQISLYDDIYRKKFKSFSIELKQKFISSCSTMKTMIEKSQSKDKNSSDDYYINSSKKILDEIIEENKQK